MFNTLFKVNYNVWKQVFTFFHLTSDPCCLVYFNNNFFIVWNKAQFRNYFKLNITLHWAGKQAHLMKRRLKRTSVLPS